MKKWFDVFSSMLPLMPGLIIVALIFFALSWIIVCATWSHVKNKIIATLDNEKEVKRDGYLSDAELSAVQCLHSNRPYTIPKASTSRLRGITPRHSREIFLVTFNSPGSFFTAYYTYIEEFDELVRTDVVELVEGIRRKNNSLIKAVIKRFNA